MSRFLMLIVLFSSCFAVTAMVSPIQRLDMAKSDLNREFGFPEDQEISVLTVTRTPIQSGPSELISHHELEQILRLLSASCIYPGNWFTRWFRGNNAADMPVYLSNGIHLNDYLDNGALQRGLSTSEMRSINRTRQKLGAYFIDNDLVNKCKFVVFNEMFFSQVCPLEKNQKDFIVGKLFDISLRTQNAVFYPNFLYSEQRQESGANIHIKFRNMEMLKNSRHMVVDDRAFNRCKQLVNQIPNDGTIHNWNFLVNESFFICNGGVLTRYRKVGYYRESDSSIGSGQLYDSGLGYDEAVGAPSSLQDVLLHNFTTDICLDLNIRVRRSSPHQWTNPPQLDSRLHIIQSNSINPFYDASNVGNLPIGRGIIHADKYPHPSWNPPSMNRPQDIFLPYYDGNTIVDDLVGSKEEFHLRFVGNDYRFSFLQI